MGWRKIWEVCCDDEDQENPSITSSSSEYALNSHLYVLTHVDYPKVTREIRQSLIDAVFALESLECVTNVLDIDPGRPNVRSAFLILQ